jgi:hypothetical protein
VDSQKDTNKEALTSLDLELSAKQRLERPEVMQKTSFFVQSANEFHQRVKFDRQSDVQDKKRVVEGCLFLISKLKLVKSAITFEI